MNKKPRVSIALCTYNGEAFLKEQLESILAQTVHPAELVVCDDCSKDATLEILYAFKERCNFPVIIIANSKNLGVNKNFEQAITHCTSEFIALADQDDIWQPTKIEELISAFQGNPECGYVFSNADLIDENGKSLGRDLWQSIKFTQKRYKRYAGGDQLEVMLRSGNFVYGMTMAFRSAYKATLLPIESSPHTCTHDTWISLILSGIGANGVAVSKSLVKYRQHRWQLAGGGHRRSFTEFIEHARKDITEVNVAFVDTLMNIVERLGHVDQNNDHLSCSIEQLTQKTIHLRARHLVSITKGFKKIKILYREAISGRYARYSGSIKSIAKDFASGSKLTLSAHPDYINISAKNPGFFLVGAVKAATTSIGYYLNQHPDIYISPIKEPHFFSKDINLQDFPWQYRKSVSIDVAAYLKKVPLLRLHVAHIENLSDYMELFREVKCERAIGDLSPSYLYSSVAAENIFTFNPSAKILILLRQPVERAYSHYLADIKGYATADSGFINALVCDFALEHKGWGISHLYVELGLYFEQVSRYLKHFPEDQVKILLYEDLLNDPVAVVKEICQFLEVDPSSLNLKNLAQRQNVAEYPILKISDRYLHIFNVFKIYIGMLVPDKFKPNIRKHLLSNKGVPKLRKEEFEQAINYFSEDIQKLSVLINRDLQSWHQFKE